MMKKIEYGLRVCLISLLVFLCLIPINVLAESKTLGDLRRIYNNLLAEKRENDNKTQAAKDQIAAKEAAVKKAEADISAAEYEQEVAEENINKSNAKIEELKLESEKILLYMQQIKSQNVYVEYVSGASNMTEMIMRIEAVKQITDYIRETTKNLEIEIQNNKKYKKELEEKQQALNKQIETYKATIARLHNNIDEYDKFALGIDEKVEQARENYEQNKKICQTNIGKSDDSVLLSDCSRVPANSGWLKPLNYGVTTSTVGSRWGSYHNALDIGGNSEGTPIYAAAAGKVVGKIYKYRCGGNMLYIDVTVNGVNYTTYYYHLLRFNVNVGDIVDQNTVIGYVGGGASTSSKYGGYDHCTTGAHLHYGVQKGWYDSSYGIIRSNVITPPGFPNATGYRWTLRTAYYK